jgi:Tol biopolymer transport system component
MVHRIVVSLAIGLGLFAAMATPAHAAFPGANGKIAFSSNRDGDFEIYSMNADGSGVTQLTNNSASDFQPAWSPDGTKIAFTSNRDPGDPDCDGEFVLCNTEIYVMNADGSGQTRLTDSPNNPEDEPSFRPDGAAVSYHRIEFCGSFGCEDNIFTQTLNGSSITRFPFGGYALDPAWRPDGGKLAFKCIAYDGACPPGNVLSGIYTANPDASSAQRLCCAYPAGSNFPDWRPDGAKLAFSQDCSPSCSSNRIAAINADGTGLVPLRDQATNPAWSPDGAKIAFDDQSGANSEIAVMNPDGTGFVDVTNNSAIDQGPSWQPTLAGAGYPRPKGATPFKTYLVIAYQPCLAPNRTHGSPLAFPSCAPPQQSSGFLTVGTADSNGAATTSVDSVRYDVMPGNPATPANEADVGVQIAMRDIRKKSDLTDYTGEVQVVENLRITDRDNGGDTGTTQDAPLPATVQCAATADTSTGSVCNLTTSVQALFPNAVKEGQRAIWELGQVQVYDGGPDGIAATPAGNTLFMDQGVFIP